MIKWKKEVNRIDFFWLLGGQNRILIIVRNQEMLREKTISKIIRNIFNSFIVVRMTASHSTCCRTKDRIFATQLDLRIYIHPCFMVTASGIILKTY